MEEKNRGGSRNTATTKMELYVARLLDLFLKKEQKNLTDTLVTQKKFFLHWDT